VRGAVNVLISSAGRRVVLLEAFRTALSDLALPGRVFASDMSRLSAAFYRADAGFVVPSCSDAGFVPALLDTCEQHDVRLVVPTIDPELPLLAASRDKFAAIGATVAVSSAEAVAIGSDKVLTHDWLVSEGFPTVRQAAIGDALDPAAPVWEFPVIVKPRWGSASIGVRTIGDRVDLARLAGTTDLVVQEIASGDEHTVDVLVGSDGRVRCAVPRRRIEVRAGEVAKAVTVRSQPLERMAADVCERLPGAFGALNVQLFLDARRDEVQVIELNARFGGGYPLSWQAGARFPRWMLEELAGLDSTASDSGWRDGLVMLRYDDAVFVDAERVGL
jgi:carbamoyl-phosphate synthase large subunit